MSKKASKFAVGAVIAAAAGYVTGILTAPKSGKETRKDIKDTAVKARVEAEKKLKQAHSELQDLIAKGQKKVSEASDKTKKGYQDAIDHAAQMKDKAKGMLSAIHEGESSDKELQQAIDEADKAIKNLKDYITKDT